MAQVALVWLCTRVSSPLIGFESIERMDEALEVKGKKLSEVEGKYLEELYVPKAVNGHT
jgi:aryl-alcohol dehydrogenase-like predicted oxidoreductase